MYLTNYNRLKNGTKKYSNAWKSNKIEIVNSTVVCPDQGKNIKKIVEDIW